MSGSELKPTWEAMDEKLLDRFVDGALSETEQRAVLARADADPQLWRALALAFVEAQFWSRELGGIASAGLSTQPVAVPAMMQTTAAPESRPIEQPRIAPVAIVQPKHGAGAGWMRPMSLVASLLVAVGIGVTAGRQIAQRQSVGLPSSSDPITKQSQFPPIDHVADRQRQDAGPSMMMLVNDDGTRIQVPVYDAAHYAGAELAQQPSGVPREVVRALRSTGHEVKKRQRILPIDLGDGRQVLVPVEQLDVQYVGDRAYQ